GPAERRQELGQRVPDEEQLDDRRDRAEDPDVRPARGAGHREPAAPEQGHEQPDRHARPERDDRQRDRDDDTVAEGARRQRLEEDVELEVHRAPNWRRRCRSATRRHRRVGYLIGSSEPGSIWYFLAMPSSVPSALRASSAALR